MTYMVVVIKVHWLIIIHVQNYCDCFPFVGLVAFLFLRGWFFFSKSAAVISLLLLPLQLLLTGPRHEQFMTLRAECSYRTPAR